MRSFGIDVGGTFTDLAAYDEASGAFSVAKVPTSPADPSQAVLDVLNSAGMPVTDVGRIVHGTTVATNALLERKGARVALVTTEGFRDLLEIGRTRRASPGLFNTKYVKPTPLIPRSSRLEVRERMLADGSVWRSLDATSVARACDRLVELRPEVVAVCLLHAYANPAHEHELRDAVLSRFDGVKVVLSSDVIPEYREYERLSTTVVNAYVLPAIEGYLSRLGRQLGAAGNRLFIMGSNSGIMSVATASAFPARTILSGPAGGVNGAIGVGEAAGLRDLVTCDMGGTSTDVSLVRGLTAGETQESMIAGVPLKLPQLDINTVGAGGGSIAWVDIDGGLRVGPLSAGAVPGPACYGRGGEAPTVTDANLHLGRLSSGSLLGGRLRLDASYAREALARLAVRASYPDVEQLAEGIIRLAITHMVGAIREISIERGHDPRVFTLIPMGGAGPMHAAEIAHEMGIRRALVPKHPGNLSATGLLSSDIRYDLSRTLIAELTDGAFDRAMAVLRELDEQARARLAEHGFSERDIGVESSVDLRYRGQAFELSVRVPVAGNIVGTVREEFGNLYAQRYGFRRAGHPAEIVALRVAARGRVRRPHLEEHAPQREPLHTAIKEHRAGYFGGRWHGSCPVYARTRLGAGASLAGPAIIEEFGSTTVVPPGWTAFIDTLGHLVLESAG